MRGDKEVVLRRKTKWRKNRGKASEIRSGAVTHIYVLLRTAAANRSTAAREPTKRWSGESERERRSSKRESGEWPRLAASKRCSWPVARVAWLNPTTENKTNTEKKRRGEYSPLSHTRRCRFPFIFIHGFVDTAERRIRPWTLRIRKLRLGLFRIDCCHVISATGYLCVSVCEREYDCMCDVMINHTQVSFYYNILPQLFSINQLFGGKTEEVFVKAV